MFKYKNDYKLIAKYSNLYIVLLTIIDLLYTLLHKYNNYSLEDLVHLFTSSVIIFTCITLYNINKNDTNLTK